MSTPAVLSEAAGVLAIAKPAGLATQAPPGIDSVEAWVRGRIPAGGYVGVPHRLDRAVSGVLLMALTPRAARKLSRQFERREVRKTYLAIVANQADACTRLDGSAAVTWRDFIEKVPDEPEARLADRQAQAAREAITRVRLLGRLPRPEAEGPAAAAGGGSWGVLELEPLTGRMHQLRLQAATRGMPILGDTRYGAAPEAWGPPIQGGEADPRTRPIALHAWRISYADPDTGSVRTAEAPLPANWPAATASLVALGPTPAGDLQTGETP